MLCIVFANTGFAQLTIITNFRQDGIWDEKNAKWDVTRTDTSTTTFDFDKAMTMFKHTTPSMASRYDFTEYDYNEETVKYTLKVKSDAGNEYEVIVDGINNCVVFFFWVNKDYRMVRHTIKETFIRGEEGQGK